MGLRKRVKWAPGHFNSVLSTWDPPLILDDSGKSSAFLLPSTAQVQLSEILYLGYPGLQTTDNEPSWAGKENPPLPLALRSEAEAPTLAQALGCSLHLIPLAGVNMGR